MLNDALPPSPPSVRARHVQHWLVLVDLYEEPYRSRFFSRLPPEVKRAIEAASPVSWVPVDLHVALADIMLAAFGPVRAHDYYRRSLPESMKSPVLASFVDTGLRVLGLSPASFLRWASKSWGLIFRDCGALQGQLTGPERGLLLYTGLPAVCTASDAWMESAQATAYGVFDVTRVEGVVRIDLSRRSVGEMRLELEWSPRRA